MSKEQNSCPQVTILQLTKLIIKEIRTMKKVLYFMGFLLAMASCESKDDAGIWADPLGYDQEDAKTVELAVAEAPAIDYATIEDVENATVQLFIPTIVAADEATATYEAVLYNSDKTKSETIDAGTDGTVKAADLQSAMISLYGNNGDTHTVPVDVNAAALVAGLGMNLTGSTTATVTLVAPEFAEYIYQAGNGNSWGSPAAPLRSENVDGKYQGYMYLNGEFKFRSHADSWDAPDWGTGGAEGTLAAQAGNLSATEGFYQVDVDLAAMTYTLTEVTSISIIGTVNGNWDTDTDLTFNPATGAWEVNDVALSAGAMKFRMNHDWTISWGGANGDAAAYDNLTQHNGKDLDVAAGTYDIQLFITCEGGNKVVLTKK